VKAKAYLLLFIPMSRGFCPRDPIKSNVLEYIPLLIIKLIFNHTILTFLSNI